MTNPAVRVATANDLDRVVDIIVLAFNADPILRWIFPDAQQFLTYFPQIIRLHAARALGSGTVHVSQEGKAAAIWFPPNLEPDIEGLIAVFQRALPPGESAAVFSVLGQMADYHLTRPHWYLRLIGVDPAAQRSGYGSALLECALNQCDVEHMPAYLEATSERSISLYQRFGFELAGKVQSPDSPPMWPMVRQAR